MQKTTAMVKKTLIPHACVVALFGYSVAFSQQPPNIIVIQADDLGYGDVGAFRALYQGGDARSSAYLHTPNLDRIALQGIRCTRAYACSWCAPSRIMLLSGQWANRLHVYDNPWIGNELRKEGYVTGLAGKVHGAASVNKLFRDTHSETAEFDDGLFFNGGMRDFYMEAGEVLPGRKGMIVSDYEASKGEYITDIFTDYGVDFIRRNARNPFMLYLAYTAPHTPLQGKPEDMRELFPDVFGNMTDDEIMATGKPQYNAKEMRNYHFTAMVYRMDIGIGQIMQALEDYHVLNRTIVIFMSDNGSIEGSNYPLTGKKQEVLEGGIRVPFIVWSEEISASNISGTVYDGLVSLADVAPTVYALATEKLWTHKTDGMNMMPFWMQQESMPHNRRYFWANHARSPELTGIDGFEDARSSALTAQSVLITDNAKVVRWNPVESAFSGAVYTHLPAALYSDTPSAVLYERTPEKRGFPKSAAGKKLLKELEQLISSYGEDLAPDWCDK